LWFRSTDFNPRSKQQRTFHGRRYIPEFLEALEQRSEKTGLKDKISLLEKSMDELPFEKESLDLIWSEGAIYNIGFENGIKNWKKFLKPGGYLVVSEIT
jgi:SAM-dependent methyltransferase